MIIKRTLLIALLSWIAISPFIQLRQVEHIIPAYWSDFYSPWMGTRAALSGADPYSTDVSGRIQVWFYGHALDPADPKERFDSQAFVYPAYAVALFAPLAILPWSVVRILLLICLPLLIALSGWLWINMCELPAGRWTGLFFLVLITASWPSVWAIRQMQPTVVVFALLTGSCYLLRRGEGTVAGILLAISMIKPNLVAPLAVWLLLLAVVHRRWRFLASFALSIAVLFGGAEAAIPGWFFRWYGAIVSYTHDVHKPPLFLLLFGRGVFGFAAIFVAALCVGFTLWRIGAPGPATANFARGGALLLAFTGCIIPGTPWMVYNHLLLVPGILILTAMRPERAVAKLARTLLLAGALWAVASVPLCAAISMGAGYRFGLAFLPFVNILMPVIVMISLLITPVLYLPKTNHDGVAVAP